MVDSSLSIYVVPALLLVAFVVVQRVQFNKRTFVNVPAVGPSGLYGGAKFIIDAHKVLQDGYEKYKNKAFKVAQLDRWMVVLSGPELVEEIRKTSEHDLSASEAANDQLQIEYTLGPNVQNDPYHAGLVRSKLTRNLDALFDRIQDEIECAFDDTLRLQGDEWLEIAASDMVMKTMSRTSNRIFVGLPLCRDPDFIELSIRFTLDVFTGAAMIKMFPNFLRGFAGRFLTTVPRSVKRGLRHLAPIIAERQKLMDEYGKDWPDRPDDMLTWLMEEAKGEQKTAKDLTTRVLALNFAALHTSSISFTHVLFSLAANPEYATLLREEIEPIVKQEGLSKASLDKMLKVDSFVRESLRYPGMGYVSMMRKAMKPLTLSDGTHLPTGTHLIVMGAPMHYDNDLYEDARTFKPFRFSDMRNKEGEELRHQAVSTSPEFITFGHGKHACPGRFFAVNALKTMLVHVVLNYDVKFKNEGVRPGSKWLTGTPLPDPKAKVMFRRRQH